MEGEKEQPKLRPNDADFSEKIRYVKESRDSDPDAYEAYITDIPQYAEGGGDPEAREQFYPGWTREDFQDLLERLQREDLID